MVHVCSRQRSWLSKCCVNVADYVRVSFTLRYLRYTKYLGREDTTGESRIGREPYCGTHLCLEKAITLIGINFVHTLPEPEAPGSYLLGRLVVSAGLR